MKSANRTHQQQANKALHPTAYSPLVPCSFSAGELGRYLTSSDLVELQSHRIQTNLAVRSKIDTTTRSRFSQ